MSQRERMLMIGIVAFLLVSIITTATTIYYYQQYSNTYQQYVKIQDSYTAIRGAVLKVSVKIDYGNGTFTTNGSVYLFRGANVLDALSAVATVNATYWPAYQSFFINAINNVFNNEKGNNRWWVFSVNGEHALVSADQYKLNDGDQIEWIYQKY